MKAKRKTAKTVMVRITPKAHAVLGAVKKRDGQPFGWQVEQALLLWAERKGVMVTA